MITLYTFGPAFGLPDPSPFVTKTEVLLKMAGLDYRTDQGGFGKAPKGKLPYIDDDGTIIADSTLIRFHLEDRHRIDFDKTLTDEQKGVSWALEKMLEDHLYWIAMRERWVDKENFDRGPRRFFVRVPFVMRPFVVAMVGRQLRRTLSGQGIGRHSQAEIDRMSQRAVAALAGVLGEKPWLMGAEPCGADATAWAFVLGGMCETFRSTVGDQMRQHVNLVAYAERGKAQWFSGPS